MSREEFHRALERWCTDLAEVSRIESRGRRGRIIANTLIGASILAGGVGVEWNEYNNQLNSYSLGPSFITAGASAIAFAGSLVAYTTNPLRALKKRKGEYS